MPRQAKNAASLSCLLTLMAVLTGCGDPCLDDGPAKGECKNAASGGETQATTGAETGDATADGTGTAEAGTNTGTGDGDGDPGDGDGDPGDGDGDDPCHNGMQDPGESGVDCGGDCVVINPLNENDIEGQCPEGDPCFGVIDCVAGECTDEGFCNVCPDEMPPEFDPMDLGYNDCQSCLLTNCCDVVIDCLENIEKCVCWFNCVENTGETQNCMDQCGNGNIGGINSCMNNACKADGNSLNCAVP